MIFEWMIGGAGSVAAADPGKAVLVVCITLFVVIGVNAMIYISVTRGNTVSQIELFRQASRRARNPWEAEDADLAELSRRVSDLRSQDQEQ